MPKTEKREHETEVEKGKAEAFQRILADLEALHPEAREPVNRAIAVFFGVRLSQF